MFRLPAPRLDALGPYRLPLLLAGILLTVFTLSRIGLLISSHSLIDGWREAARLMGWGLRLDAQLIGYLLLPPVLATPLLFHRPTRRTWAALMVTYATLVIAAAVLMEVSTPDFLAEYGVRPNRLYFEYLDAPGEVLPMLLKGRTASLLLGLAAVLGCAVASAWYLSSEAKAVPAPRGRDLLWFTPALLLCVAMARGTTGHRPLNPASAAITSSQVLNDLPMSSLYSVAYAGYAMKNESNLAMHYGHISPDDSLQRVRGDMDATRFLDGTWHWSQPSRPARGHNFVLLLEESLGAEFVDRLGGQSLTPELDRLSRQGWWFDRLYATGTRSVRGIEATITGFLPSPARSVVKLPGAQQNFYTLARSLRDAGYRTRFVYGGDANFDNMRRFLSNNGFDEVVEQRDFPDDLDRTTWGVADEHVLHRVHRMLEEAPEDEPQFIFVFTSSNHEPFDIPPGRFEPVAQPLERVENAVRYADWSLGRFFDEARDADYWDRSLFLVVADHNSRVYGDDLVPIDRFHIPGLFLGGDITPRTTTDLVSQIDLPVTALSLLGIEAIHPMVGRDLTGDTPVNRAILQYRDNQAFVTDDRVVVLRPDLSPSFWTTSPDGLQPAATDDALASRALAYASWARIAYQAQLYSPPEVRP